ncbi:MAG: glycosyltransferase [Bacteroidetes bacterium]|nr:glycosyltransferase [Bacteroidota bacterium]
MNQFSIILPVRNGGQYLRVCVNSILSQTYTGFNLIVLDNNSTDGSREWLESLQDQRIIIYKSDNDLTIEENWGRIKGVSKNEYITLIGHDDVLDPDFLSVIDRLIQNHPTASLFHTHFSYIDKDGNAFRACKPMPNLLQPEELLQKTLHTDIDIMGTGYVMRATDYDRIGGIPPYPNLLFADFELWLRLTSLSYMVISPETHFSFRVHQSTTTISHDRKYLQAFEQLVNYLERLRTEKETWKNVIQADSVPFLNFYCKGLCHRLLRTPAKNRQGLTVALLIERFRGYANRLAPGADFKPQKISSIRLALLIDSNGFFRACFLLFKKVFPKPLLK